MLPMAATNVRVVILLCWFSFCQAIMKAKPPSGRDSHEMHLAEVKHFVK